MWTKRLFTFGEIRSIVCYCTHEEKINFDDFTQNGSYGNQPQPLQILFDSINVNNSCSFTKQDLIFIQGYLVGFCFVLFNKLKFWQLALVYNAFYRLYLEITLFCPKPSERIICCHLTYVKMFSLLITDTNTPQSRNASVKSVCSKVAKWAYLKLFCMMN